MSRSDDLARAEALLAQLQGGKVVSLGRVRRVADIVRRLRSDDAAQGLLASLASELLESVCWWERRLIDHVERVCLEHPSIGGSELASLVAKDREFQRLNRLLRWNRAVYLREDLPEVHVRDHIREGRRVRAHSRLVGYGHLVDIDVPDRGPRVRMVVRYLTRRSHRRR
jgi:hypothetical protein